MTAIKEEKKNRSDIFMVKFSEVAKSLHASDIREILKVTENPEIISFAGGLL